MIETGNCNEDIRLTALKQCSLLSGIPETALSELAVATQGTSVERGGIIWMNGRKLDFFGLVVAGFVKMVKTTPIGREVTAELIGPGQVFGMLGAVDGTGCPLMARAATLLSYIRIPSSAFLPLYNTYPSVRDALVSRSGLRLRNTFETLAMMSTGRVEQRVAAVLLTLAGSYGETAGLGVRITAPLTRQDVADLAGTTLESAIRTLSRWEREGLARTDQRFITVLAEDALAGIATGANRS
jgi:CRP/FNR family transcriptional regulator